MRRGGHYMLAIVSGVSAFIAIHGFGVQLKAL